MSAKWKKGTGGPAGDEVQNLVLAPSLTAANDPSRSPQAQEVTRQYEAMDRAGAGVRRLTPRECERLQALPDDWTAHGADSRRYAALGDAVTASVAEWIGQRLLMQERGR